jgi:hypothetical protein
MKKVKALALVAPTLFSLNTQALGPVPHDFYFKAGTKLTCVSGPGVLKLNFEKVEDYHHRNTATYKVSGHGLTNTFGVNSKDFTGTLRVREVSTRAYFGHEIDGVLNEVQGKVSLKNHVWYSYAFEDLPTFFTGTFDSFEANQAYKLTCFPVKEQF